MNATIHAGKKRPTHYVIRIFARYGSGYPVLLREWRLRDARTVAARYCYGIVTIHRGYGRDDGSGTYDAEPIAR